MNRFTAQNSCFLILFFLVLAYTASGQETRKNISADKPVSADESFTLNITESRTSETNYERSTRVEVGRRDESAVFVGVGAAVQAQKIVITLRGITGDVRFRASLEKIRRLLE
jgi:hypothetical protein